MATLMRSLRQVPFLQPLTDEQLIQLVEKGQRQAIVAGQVLFHKGEAGHCLYALLDGQVQISQNRHARKGWRRGEPP